jgi:hypothetical protein
MASPLMLLPEQRWTCPRCGASEVTHLPAPGPGESLSRMHGCGALGGIPIPFVADGIRCEIVAVEREDYVGGARGLRYADGRPIMAVRTRRDDGEDCTVYPEVATVSMAALTGGS